jgi:uncharacterized RDD family membrane protein YckC
VLAADGGPPGGLRSAVRLVGLGLAIIPLGAGFLPVLVDDRRRALQDFLAGTVVLYDVTTGSANTVAQSRLTLTTVKSCASACSAPAV